MSRMYSWLRHAIESGAAIVTVNKRLARDLRSAWDEQQLARGLRGWHTPRIQSWAVWLNGLYEHAEHASGPMPLRLDTHASGIIWERLLREAAGERILNPAGLVRQAQQTWQRLNDWCVSPDDLRQHASSDDERLFAAIATAYQRELAQNSWIDHAQLAPCVATLIEKGEIRPAGPVVYAGFDRLVPAAMRLFRALSDSDPGSVANAAPHAELRQSLDVASSRDADAELRAAGLWARRQLQENAAAKVAVVCPGLEQDAPRAARLVREGLAPGWQEGGERHAGAVNVSYGKRLSAYPLIAIALQWLGWSCQGIPSRDVSLLLRSPFAGRGDTDGRCQLEASLRRLPDRIWRPATLAAALRHGEQSPEVVDWLQRVDRVAAMEQERSRVDSPGVWAAAIDDLLRQLGWPGDRPLDSGEFQLVNRWRELLNGLSRLDVVRPQMHFSEAVARLSSFARDTVWQPETGAGLIQLLGPLEAAGLEFDKLWISSLDAQQWPPAAHPLPLVSRALQRKLAMPDATPAETLEFSRRVLQRLAGSAASVVFSWARSEQDLELEPSPLLAPYVARAAGESEDPGWFASRHCGRDVVDRQLPDPVPALRSGEKVRGGATVVQRQFDDPFSAFAYGRLGVRDLQAIEPGLSAGTRGNIIHRALHRLLLDRPASTDVASWSAAELEERIDRSVDDALSGHVRYADGVLRRLLAFERRRLRELLRTFAAAEVLRQPFAVVAVEESVPFLRHGVQLDLRIDRIDRLADGSLLIADYKTGAVKNLLNQAGEPKQLQLVVYASAVDAPVGGLVLINVDSRGIVYKGVGGSVEWDRSTSEPWAERLRGWQDDVDDALTRLAAGDVRLNLARTVAEIRPLNVLSRAEELKRAR